MDSTFQSQNMQSLSSLSTPYSLFDSLTFDIYDKKTGKNEMAKTLLC